MGRSGSTFLSRLLAPSSNAAVFHEYIGNREFWLLSYYLDSSVYAVPYLEKSKEEINKHFAESRHDIFVDVNPGLHHSVGALREVFRESMLFHLVRDPRKVIPSLYVRRSDKNPHIIPKTREGVEFWLDADKFCQICWNWADAVSRLMEQGVKTLLFERVISDYEYLSRTLLEPSGLSITREAWEGIKDVKIKKTYGKGYRYLYSLLKRKEFIGDEPIPYDEWSDYQRDMFSRICGEVMKKLGYE